MAPVNTDRNLLFGLLALQTGLIDQGSLFAAFAAWTRDKGRSLADHLIDLGYLDAPRRAAVDAIAGLHVQALGGDPARSLGVLAIGRSTRESLARVGGPDVEATLGHVDSANGSTHDDDLPDRTGSYSMGSATSDGQRFRILRPHAKGGLGAVFVALDSELDREVALKQILDDRADDPTSRFRFLIEAQITGGLEHPGIVPVYGLGTYGDGRPYYAMRFIRGDSLKEAIDRFHQRENTQIPCPVVANGQGGGAGRATAGSRDLALRKLIRRFMDVCNAIDYAHSRGVIHRDIKPANIILGKHGETLVVDWGLAKPMGQVEPGTDSGERLLMPSSASGSYLTRSQAAVQARYELAVEAIKTFHTGVSEDFLLKQEQFKDVRDRLLKSASDFYGKLGALLGKETDIASRRAVGQANFDVAELTDKVGKPEDALAAHRQVLAAREALAAESPADSEIKADVARSLTALAGLLETTGRTAESEMTYRKVERMLVELTPEITQTSAARVVLSHCRSRLGWLLHSTGRDDEALSYYRLARADEETLAAATGASADSRRDLAATINGTAVLLAATGKPSEAETEYRTALAIRQKLVDDHPAVSQFGSDLALSHNDLGRLLAETGNSSLAEAEYRTALAIQKKLADDNAAVAQLRSDLATSHCDLGLLLSNTGKSSAAETEYRKALAIQQKLANDHPAVTLFRSRLAQSHLNLGWLLHRTGNSSEAEIEFRNALAIQQKLADENPAVTLFRSRLSSSHINLGWLLSNTGKTSDAEAEYREALALEQKLADDNPAIPKFQRDLALGLLQIGWQLAQAGKTDEAIVYYTREEVIRRKLALASSATPEDKDFLANCQNNTADLLRRSGMLDEALAACQRSLAVREPLVEAHPDFPSYRAGLGETYLRLGQVRSDQKNLAAAAAAWKRACGHYDATKSLTGEQTFFFACCHACLAGLAGRPGSGVSTAERADQAENAMAVLRQAVAMGYRSPDAFRNESALDALRQRTDFRALMLDLAFPTQPFAP